MKAENRDKPLYVALFTEGAFQNLLDKKAGKYLHELIGKGAESKIMDAAMGLGHRLKAGHDLQALVDLMREEGLDGARTWFQHMFADLMSPHGIPLPGASYVYRFLEDTLPKGVREKFFVDWGCVSATDVVSGGLALLLLARMHKIATEQERLRRLASLTISQILTISFAEANPFFIVNVSLQTLLMRHEWKKWQLKRLQEGLSLSERIADDSAVLIERARA